VIPAKAIRSSTDAVFVSIPFTRASPWNQSLALPIVVRTAMIPERCLDLLAKPIVSNLVTLMPDGSPQVTPMWFEFDGEHIIMNSARGKVKERNMRRDPRVAVLIVSSDNPYRYIQIQGRVVEISEEGAEDSIDRLARKYLGLDAYPDRKQDEVRVMYKIVPEHVSGMG
jgi:PPOX class probable F420-dependent enzyme